MIATPQLTPAAQAWETELALEAVRSEAFLARLERERRERVMRAGREKAVAREPEYAI